MTGQGAPRVLHVSHSAQPGGSNEDLLSVLRHRPAGVASHVVFLEDGPELARVRELGVGADLLPVGRARELWKVPGAVAALRTTIRRHRADVVFAHVSKAHVYAWTAARLAGVPELWWQHERLDLQRPLQELGGRMRASAVLCSSTRTGAAQAARFPRTPVRVVHPGPELDGFDAPRIHHGGAAAGPPSIAAVGRLQRWKRFELAVRALPAIREQVPDAELVVIGDASPGLDEDYPAELAALARRLGVPDAVRFAGHVDDVPRRLCDADVLLHTSADEPFGRVVVEAMLAGVPPVAAAEGGPLEIVRDGVDGLLVDPTDTAALSAAVAGLLADPARRAAMGAAGRQRALERFTAQRMAADVWDAISAATGE